MNKEEDSQSHKDYDKQRGKMLDSENDEGDENLMSYCEGDNSRKKHQKYKEVPDSTRKTEYRSQNNPQDKKDEDYDTICQNDLQQKLEEFAFDDPGQSQSNHNKQSMARQARLGATTTNPYNNMDDDDLQSCYSLYSKYEPMPHMGAGSIVGRATGTSSIKSSKHISRT